MFTNLLDQCSKEPNVMSKTSLQNQTRFSHLQHVFNQPTAHQQLADSPEHGLPSSTQATDSYAANYIFENCVQMPIKEGINEFMQL